MKLWNQILINLVVASVTGSVVFAFCMTYVVGDTNSNTKDISYLKEEVNVEIQERKFSDSQLESHLQQNSDLMKASIEQSAQLIALIKAENQVRPN